MEKSLAKSPEPSKRPSPISKTVAIAALGLSTMACKASDVFGSPDPVSTFARGAIGAAALGAELFGFKPLTNALRHDTNFGWAVFKLGAMVGIPLAAGAVCEVYPIASYILFYTPIAVGFIHLTSRR